MKLSELASGVTIGGRYRLVDIVGRGGFGDVWETVRLLDGERIALKVYHHQDRGNRVLFSEARQATRFDHPRLVRVFGADRIDGIYCMEMEFVPGQTLADRLGDNERPLYVTVGEAMEWMIQVAEGLTYLHGLTPPTTHGDIKPDNLIISPAGIKLTDFGHSRQIEDRFAITRGGGTWLYMAPEVHTRDERRIASDVYSFGAVFYRVLTGRCPRQTLAEVLNMAPFPRPCEVNSAILAEIDELIVRCLQNQPEHRYADGPELLAALRRVAQAFDTSTAPVLAASAVPSEVPTPSPLDRIERAQHMAVEGDYEGALAAVDVAIRQISTNREILLFYGHLAEKCGHLQTARGALERLIRRLVSDGATADEQREARERLGELQVQLKVFEEAVETFVFLHMAYPDDLWYAYRYGIALGLASRPRESVAVLEEVRRRRPDLASVPAKIGFAYLQMKEHRVAVQYFNEALMLDEAEPTALCYLALIRFIEGRTDRAMTYYRRLAASDDQHGLAADLARKLGIAAPI